MTLGTNANLEELIKYSPQEINFDFILAELKELREWRELGESVGDVEGRINLDAHQYEIERLKETIDDMISSD